LLKSLINNFVLKIVYYNFVLKLKIFFEVKKIFFDIFLIIAIFVNNWNFSVKNWKLLRN